MLQDKIIVGRVANQGHTVAILGSRTDESHTADIDILDCLGSGYIRFGDRGFERVKV
jgi:hypothetical protein